MIAWPRAAPSETGWYPRMVRTSSLLKKVFEVSRSATLIQDPSARRTKDSQPSGFGFECCALPVRFRVFQQTARRSVHPVRLRAVSARRLPDAWGGWINIVRRSLQAEIDKAR